MHYICFNKTTCDRALPLRACLLLIEVLNARDCEYHARMDEVLPGRVLRACGLDTVCGFGGLSMDR